MLKNTNIDVYVFDAKKLETVFFVKMYKMYYSPFLWNKKNIPAKLIPKPFQLENLNQWIIQLILLFKTMFLQFYKGLTLSKMHLTAYFTYWPPTPRG